MEILLENKNKSFINKMNELYSTFSILNVNKSVVQSKDNFLGAFNFKNLSNISPIFLKENKSIENQNSDSNESNDNNQGNENNNNDNNDNNENEDSENNSKLVKNIESKKQDYRNLLAGFFSSSISRTIVAPLDRLKMLYQVNYIGEQTKPPKIRHGLQNIYLEEGFRGFFKGNFINILKGSPEQGIKLYIFEKIKWKMQIYYSEEKLSKKQLFSCGAISGFISSILVFPLEVIKVRIAASPVGTYTGVFDAIGKIYREPKGCWNFYSGVEATVCSTIPNAGINLSIYETLKCYVSGSNSVDNASNLSALKLMLIGGCASFISSTLLYPLHLIQSRMIMFNLMEDELRRKPINSKFMNKYKFTKALYTTSKVEGIGGFYKGYKPGITKIVIGNGIGFSVYEKLKLFFGVNIARNK
jgi:solute carrier family 25 phosphate transporter 23/24/25/41